MHRYSIFIISSLCIGGLLYLLSLYNYLFFHLTIELFTMLIGTLIFTVAVIAKKFDRKSFLIILGPGIMVASLITFLHMATFKGMGIIPGYDANLPTQLWIILNYILATSIFIALWQGSSKFNFNAAFALYFCLGLVAVFLCLIRIFPDCFVEGQGLTRFKIFSEYVIILEYFFCLYLLWRRKSKLSGEIYQTMQIVLILLAISEWMFTLYLNIYGIFNFAGHYLRLVAFSLVYLYLVIEGIQKPYQTIFMELNALSVTDGLTNLYNHRFFQASLEKHAKMEFPQDRYLFLMVMDIDNFKEINDTHGHLTGDKVLIETAGIISSQIRKSDVAARQGGDEFSVILNGATIEEAKQIMQQIRDAVVAADITAEKIHITLSGGVAKYTGGCTQELIKKADQLLYQAKKQGRNKIIFEYD